MIDKDEPECQSATRIQPQITPIAIVLHGHTVAIPASDHS